MRKCNSECEYFKSIKNTKTCKQGICSYPDSYFPVELDRDCPIMPKPYTCKDCDRFGADFACMTCEAEDSAYIDDKLCCGFIDKQEEQVRGALFDWSLRGYNIEDKLAEIVKDFKEKFKPL